MPYVGESFKIWYVAKDFRSGLTDVRMTVIKPDLNLQGVYSLSEYNTHGMYYFDYEDSDIEGTYLFIINSASWPLKDAKMFLFEKRIWTETNRNQLFSDVSFLKNIEGGSWKLLSPNDLVYYTQAGVEIARFKCYDTWNNPTLENIMQVIRIS